MINQIYMNNLFLYFINVMHSNMFLYIIVLISLDIFTGLMKSLVMKTTSSDIGIKGWIKHVSVIMVTFIIIMMYYISNDLYVNFGLSSIIIYIFIFYLISIIENLIYIGVPFPNSFLKNLNKLKDDIEDEQKD